MCAKFGANEPHIFRKLAPSPERKIEPFILYLTCLKYVSEVYDSVDAT